MILPTENFKDNLAMLAPVDGVSKIELLDSNDSVVATIENIPGKQGSLKVYAYLASEFGALNAKAAEHGLQVFAEHTDDAKQRPGAHPNIDRLFDVISNGMSLKIRTYEI